MKPANVIRINKSKERHIFTHYKTASLYLLLIITDLKEAFDALDRNIRMKKLKRYGI